MKLRNLVAFFIILSAICAISCGRVDSGAAVAATPTPVPTEMPVQFDPTPTPTPDQGPPQTGTANFRGVSITPAIPGVTAIQPTEEPAWALQDPTNRPDGVAPRHILLRFLGPYPDRVDRSYFGQPEIGIFPVAGYPEVWAISEEGARSTQKQFEMLRGILKAQPKTLKEVPQVHFIDGTVAAITHVKYITFKNGSGVLYLAPFMMELDVVRDRSLTYIFQGFTADGKYYIFGAFPVSSKVLPGRGTTPEYKGYNALDFFGKDGKRTARYEEYLAYIKAALESQNPGDFDPGLESIEKTLSSLEVNW
jgi:hypothetical protein